MTDEAMILRAKQVFDVEIEGLKKTRDSVGASFVSAVKLISDCVSHDGIVVVTGVGKNLHVAEKMSAIFASTGTRSIVLNPVQAMHGDLGMVSSRDLLLALSFSGESDEVVRLIPAIRRHGLKVISMTGKPESTLAKLSDLHIEIPCGKEACPFGMAPTNSVTATLAMVLIDAQKFSLADYAANHPAGAIGRALVLKATDIMRTGARLAKVAPTATVMETVMAMTKAQGGSAAIADETGKLLGIFTDGDFRRIMATCASERTGLTQRNGETESQGSSRAEGLGSPLLRSSALENGCNEFSILSDPISSHMTRSPKFVYDTAYAVELLKIFEKMKIDDLPVCDADGRIVGLVDIQDLPKMKVM